MSNVYSLRVQVGHDPEGTIIGLDTGDHRYAWPTDDMPVIIRALRACANGDPRPAGANGMVFAHGDRVALTDEPPKTTFQNVQGEAALVQVAAASYVMTKRAARDLADGFEEAYQKLRAQRSTDR